MGKYCQNKNCTCCYSQNQKVTTCDPIKRTSWNDIEFVPDRLSDSNVYQTKKVTLSAADVLSLATRKRLLNDISTSLMYDVSSVVLRVGSGTLYAASGNIEVDMSGTPLFEKNANVLTSSGLSQMVKVDNNGNVIAGSGLFIAISGANPTTGNALLDVYITYRLIAL